MSESLWNEEKGRVKDEQSTQEKAQEARESHVSMSDEEHAWICLGKVLSDVEHRRVN